MRTVWGDKCAQQRGQDGGKKEEQETMNLEAAQKHAHVRCATKYTAARDTGRTPLRQIRQIQQR